MGLPQPGLRSGPDKSLISPDLTQPWALRSCGACSQPTLCLGTGARLALANGEQPGGRVAMGHSERKSESTTT